MKRSPKLRWRLGLWSVLVLLAISPLGAQAQDGTLKWLFQTGSHSFSSPAIGADGTIYVGWEARVLYAINPDGTLKWAFQTGGYIYSSPAIGADGTIYVGCEAGALYAINPDGTLKWAFQTGGYIYSSPAIGTDGTIYAASGSGKFYAINPDGSLKWETERLGSQDFASSPAIGADGTIYVGTDFNVKLYAFNPDGTVKWAYQAGGGYIVSSPGIGYGGEIYVGSEDGNLYAINPDGTLKWTYQTGGCIGASPVIGTDGTIYVADGHWWKPGEAKLHAINLDGTLKWAYSIGGDEALCSASIGADGTIYVGSGYPGNQLYAINPDGTLKWTFQTGIFVSINSPTIGPDGTIYVGAYGKLFAINTTCGGLANSPWPMFRHDVRHTGLWTAVNRPPVANAGSDQTVHAGTTVNLDGSGSSDPDGNLPLTYAWRFVSRPGGSNAQLSGPGAVNPTFVADVVSSEPWVVELVVTDSLGAKSAPATVRVSSINSAPVADAGPDQAITVIGTPITLTGGGSYDPDGDPLIYQWSFTAFPGDTPPTLTGADTATPGFTAAAHFDYRLKLVVRDGWADSEPAYVNIKFTNVTPVANAGPNQAVVIGDTVNLNGSGSTDANGDPLTYKWDLTTKPGDSTLSFSSTALAPSFIPDVPGTYVVQLIVNDGFVDSPASTVQILVSPTASWITEEIRDLTQTVGALPPAVFKNKTLGNALINKLQAVINQIDAGNYTGALAKLRDDVIPKTDGCATGGVPDANDWITDCETQGQVYPYLMDLAGHLAELAGQ